MPDAPETPRFWPSEWERVGRTKGDTRTRGYIYRGSKPFEFVKPRGGKTTLQPGDRISERQYSNLRYQGGGWKFKSEWETFQRVRRAKRPSLEGKKLKLGHQAGAWKVWAGWFSQEQDIPLREVEAPDSQYNMLFTAAMRSGWDTSPDGAWARLLAMCGVRPYDADWNVGETQGEAVAK